MRSQLKSDGEYSTWLRPTQETPADSEFLRVQRGNVEFLGATQIVLSQLDVTHGTSCDSEFPRV